MGKGKKPKDTQPKALTKELKKEERRVKDEFKRSEKKKFGKRKDEDFERLKGQVGKLNLQIKDAKGDGKKS
jgi:hypothetical protein